MVAGHLKFWETVFTVLSTRCIHESVIRVWSSAKARIAPDPKRSKISCMQQQNKRHPVNSAVAFTFM
jgi:hypothetical protein